MANYYKSLYENAIKVCDALKAELKLLRGKVDPVLYMAKNIHNNSYATSFKEAEAKLYLAQSGLKNDGIEATIIPLFTHPPAQNSNVDDLGEKCAQEPTAWCWYNKYTMTFTLGNYCPEEDTFPDNAIDIEPLFTHPQHRTII